MIEDEVCVPGPGVGLHGGVSRGEHGDEAGEMRGVRPLNTGQETGKLKSEKVLHCSRYRNKIQSCHVPNPFS